MDGVGLPTIRDVDEAPEDNADIITAISDNKLENEEAVHSAQKTRDDVKKHQIEGEQAPRLQRQKAIERQYSNTFQTITCTGFLIQVYISKLLYRLDVFFYNSND